jgi:hypothetical protein
MAAGRSPGRERNQMILSAIYEVAGGTTKLCPYEDLVVRAWELFPHEFGLRGYVDKYPDSSDLHKPLYGPLKRDGLIRVRNKKFGLTEAGLAVAERLRRPDGQQELGGPGRIRRDQVIEIERLAKKPAVQLVQQDRVGELLDTDLYDFYGVTVRTKPADFAGRISTVDSAIEAAVNAQDPSIEKERLAWVVLTRDALKDGMSDLITERTTAREKVR